MEDRTHAQIAIVFIVVFAVGAVVIALWMTKPGTVREPYLLNAHSSVAGLGEGSAVQFNGVKIGVVKSIRIDAQTHRSIEVTIAIDKQFPLPEGSYATIGSSGLVGPTTVEIHLGSSQQIMATSAAQPARLDLRAGGLSAMLDDAKQIVGQAKQMLASVQQLISQQNITRLNAIIANIEQASAQLVTIEKAVVPGAKQLPQLLTELRSTMAQARALLANANRLVVNARAPLSAMGRAANSTASLTARLGQQTVPQLQATLAQLDTLMRHLQALAIELKRAPQSLIAGPPVPQPGPGEDGGKH